MRKNAKQKWNLIVSTAYHNCIEFTSSCRMQAIHVAKVASYNETNEKRPIIDVKFFDQFHGFILQIVEYDIAERGPIVLLFSGRCLPFVYLLLLNRSQGRHQKSSYTIDAHMACIRLYLAPTHPLCISTAEPFPAQLFFSSSSKQ